MARHAEESSGNAGVRVAVEQLRVSEQVKRFFGIKPLSVQILKGRAGQCAVAKVPLGVCRTAEFILDNGLLVGIPPFPKRGNQ